MSTCAVRGEYPVSTCAVRGEYPARTAASTLSGPMQVRIARVGVVYGIAGVGNKFIRKGLREATE